VEDAPFEGIRVVELAQWVFVPTAAMLLADWGADVIKIEPKTGDAYGGLATQGIGRDGERGVNLALALVNRGKRSMVLDLHNEQGLEVMHRLLEQADVFVTNLRGPALERLGLDAGTLTARYPRLVYARGTGYGTRGPDADRSGYDSSAFWARGGLAHVLTPTDAPHPIVQRGAMGDRNAGTALAFGMAAALLRQARTGKGSVVDTSLLATAVWTLASDVMTSLEGRVAGEIPRWVNPVFGTYATSDGRHIQLTMMESDRYWDVFCRALGRSDMVDDPRFVDLAARSANKEACIAELQDEFGKRTFAECKAMLGAVDLPWAPVQSIEELIEDPQVVANGYIGEVTIDGGPTYRIPTAQVQLDGRPVEMRRAPEVGEHTEAVLLELGYSWDEIMELSEQGATL
jgi:crotonobetainyl-CoA:carnitine CoA-transferase CaiB-like acyl-CoA transferase